MKKTLFLIFVLILVPGAAFATTFPEDEREVYEGMYMEEVQKNESGRFYNQPKPLPDYFSKTSVPLTAEEKKNLAKARAWATSPSQPICLTNGKMAFLHGASVPTLIAAPFNITDLELEAGESIENVLLGDAARWSIDSSYVGNIPHIFFKPLDTGLETSCVVTTNRRVYHLRLVSQRKGFMPYVGFLYAEHRIAFIRASREKAAQEHHVKTTVINGKTVDLTALDFGYKVDGDLHVGWKPVQVYSDGQKTYIKLPAKVQEMPVLLAKNGGDILINYRVENNTFIVDGDITEVMLILGVGSNQKKITVKKA